MLTQRIHRITRSPHFICAIVLIAHALLSTVYSFVTPVFESYDETGHYSYARYIALNHQLPPLGAQLSAQNESHQPPLYYSLVALAISGIDMSDDVQAEFIFSPQVAVKPVPQLAFPGCLPGCGTALAVHAGRLVSVIFSTLAVLCTYLTALTLLPKRKDIALIATTIHAFWPMLLFMGGVLSNDNGIILFISLTLLFAARLLMAPAAQMAVQRWADYALLGASMAGATMMKDSAISAVLFGGLVLVTLALRDLRARRYRRLPEPVICIAAFVALALVGVITSDGRTLRQFGTVMDFASTLGSTNMPSTPSVAVSSSAGWLNWIVQVLIGSTRDWIFKTFLGTFGWSNIYMPDAWYTIASVLMLVALLGVLFALIRDKRWQPFLTLSVFAVCVALAPIARATVARQVLLLHGRFFLPALGAICIALAIGVVSLPRLFRQLGTAGLLAGVMAGGVLAPAVVIGPVFERPPLYAGKVGEFSPPNPVSITYGDAIELIGYNLPEERPSHGQWMYVSLYWRALRPLDKDYLLQVEAFGVDGRSFGMFEKSEPAGGASPTSKWRPGEVYMTGTSMPVWEHVPTPIVATFKASWLDKTSGEALQVRCAQNESCDGKLGRMPVTLTSMEAEQWEREVGCCEFGGQVELIEAHAPANVSDGQLLTVTLIWRARQNGLPPLTSFVHLESADGKLVSQADTPPRGNTYPTDVWAAGEIVPDAIVLKIDDSVPPGEYDLKIGLYDSATQQRLPIQDRFGQPLPDGMVNVQKVQVVRP